MRQGSVLIGIAIVITSLCIYFIKNQQILLNLIDKYNKSKIKKRMRINEFSIIMIIVTCVMVISFTQNVVDSVNRYNKKIKRDEMFEMADRKIEQEEEEYLEIFNKEYKNQAYDKPYIPEGFSYVEGSYDTGFVIQDEKQNQYVWVPCTNKDIDGIEKLERRNFATPAFISKETCYNERYKEFVRSALENGGFYISRYEIGKENNIPVSKKGAEVWSNITRDDAVRIIETMYKDKSITCELMNGYAYDTTLQWIKNNNEITYNMIDFEKEKNIYSGRNVYNGIYDFVDNVLEFSLEILYDTYIVRGFSFQSYDEEAIVKFRDESRYALMKDFSIISLVDALSFRVVLYK